MENIRIILASSSPRRRELLKLVYPSFEAVSASCEERTAEQRPDRIVMDLAGQKARAVWEALHPSRSTLVIGADTIVVSGGKVLGKPADEADAVQTLTQLSGNSHEVYTGVCLLWRRGEEEQKIRQFYERTYVSFYPLSPEEIEAYVRSGEPMDKAGSYGIQGSFAKYVKGISGDYDTVVGLCVSRLYQELKAAGLL